MAEWNDDNVICHDLHEGEDDYWDWLREKLGPDVLERGHGCDANGWLARPWHLEEKYHPTNWTNDVTLQQLRRRDPTRPLLSAAMFGRGTSAGLTLTVLATRPPTPPAAALSRVIPSLDVGPAAVMIGFLSFSPANSVLMSAIPRTMILLT